MFGPFTSPCGSGPDHLSCVNPCCVEVNPCTILPLYPITSYLQPIVFTSHVANEKLAHVPASWKGVRVFMPLEARPQAGIDSNFRDIPGSDASNRTSALQHRKDFSIGKAVKVYTVNTTGTTVISTPL